MKRLLTLVVAFAVILIFIGLMPINGEAEIYDNVVRLHVIANSDSEADQDLKLKVRDEVLKSVSSFVYECDDKEEASELIKENLLKIEVAAKDCIEREGYNYPVSVVLGREIYPTKNYESFCFPSGEYLSLQVKIGEAEGENWWCVLFPPLCMSAAGEANSVNAEDAFIKLGLTGEQYRVITNSENSKYVVRFKILEAAQQLIS